MRGRPRGTKAGEAPKALNSKGLVQEEGPVEPDLDRQWVERVRQGLVAWNEESHRHLPWRDEPDPYRILVSEMMLVQTTVAAVIPYFERFLKQIPGSAGAGVGR